jgi:hypothetical protein
MSSIATTNETSNATSLPTANAATLSSKPQIVIDRNDTFLIGPQIARKCSIPICFDDCSTTDHTAQSLRMSRLTFPDFETERSSRPRSRPRSSRR